MHGILPWHIWIIIGILFIIIEILDPAFFFVALGFGAILTGLLSLLPFVEASIPLQIIIFAILSFVAFLLTRHLGKKFLAGWESVFSLLRASPYFAALAFVWQEETQAEGQSMPDVLEDMGQFQSLFVDLAEFIAA